METTDAEPLTEFKQFMKEWENYTDDTDNSTFCNADLVPKWFYSIFLPVFYCVIFLLGVTGNTLMITVLLRRRHRLRIAEIYLLHLALADLMLLFTFPFELVNCFTGWIFGVFLCMLKGVLKEMNLFCGSLLLAFIGFDRYLAIVHAIPSMQNRRPTTVHLTCISLWVFCLLLSLPNAVFLSVDTNTSNPDCFHHRFEIHAHNWVVANRILQHVCFFFSLVVMTYCYSALANTLSKSKKSQARKGAIRLAVVVTLVFCLCWLPYNITSLIRSIVEMGYASVTSCEFSRLLEQVFEATLSIGISHCCLNPLLYAFVGGQFRKELVQLLCQLSCGHICQPFIKSKGHGRPSISERTTNSTNY